jgi:hypothetical protein
LFKGGCWCVWNRAIIAHNLKNNTSEKKKRKEEKKKKRSANQIRPKTKNTIRNHTLLGFPLSEVTNLCVTLKK